MATRADCVGSSLYVHVHGMKGEEEGDEGCRGGDNIFASR